MNVYLYTGMSIFIISMGSNENKAENMSRCRTLLRHFYVDVLFSEMITTEPFGTSYKVDFYNQLALVNSNDDELLIKDKLKRIELEIGRQSEDKSKGIIKIDVDLLVVDDKVVKSEDFERPYINRLLKDLLKKADIILSTHFSSFLYTRLQQ